MEPNLEISFVEFQQLPVKEKLAIRNKGNKMCKDLAREYLVKNNKIDYVVYVYHDGEFHVEKKGIYSDIPPGRNSPFNEYLFTLEKDINKIVFAFYRPPLVESIHDPVFAKEFEGYY